MSKVQSPVGHGAVANFQQRIEQLVIQSALLCGGAHKIEHNTGTLDTLADFQESPAVTTRHVFLLHPAEGGEI